MKASNLEDRSRLASKQLVQRHYRELESEEFSQRKVVYIFTSGSISELFRSFGFRIVYPELNAIHSARNMQAVEMIHHGEELGYSSEICSYVKCNMGLVAGPPSGKSPFGQIPPPDLVVINHSGCSTYIKWGEALAREFGCPLKMVDVPFAREDVHPEFDRKYVQAQIEDLLPVCESITGNKFDLDKLRGILDLTSQAIDLWMKIQDYGKLKPSPLDEYFDGVSYMAPMTLWRGTREAVNFYRIAIEQIEERVANGFSPVGEEKFRVLFEGSPPWPNFNEFRNMFAKWGVVAVASSYSNVVCACRELTTDPSRPIEYLADLATQSFYNWNHAKKLRFLEELAVEFQVDAIVAHSVRSCRPMSIGQLDLRRYFAREKGIPTLFLDSDIADPRFFSSGELMNKIDTFFEMLSGLVDIDPVKAG